MSATSEVKRVSSAEDLSSLQSSSSRLSSVSAAALETSAASIDSTAKAARWVWDKHAGLARVTGFAVVPSQFIGPGLEESTEIIDEAVERSAANRLPSIEKVSFPDSELKGIVIYPPGYDRTDMSKAVLYNNPNGMVVARFFTGRELHLYTPPYQFMLRYNCPVIMYDYRGTGLSSGLEEDCGSSIIARRPDAGTVVEDGIVALRTAASRYQKVLTIGSSLGGGVATAALESYISGTPVESQSLAKDRFSLINHDSFRTTGSVVAPWPIDKVASLFGAQIDAETAMRSLVERQVKILVLCHDQDPVIPERARIALMDGLAEAPTVSIVRSDDYGHANLDATMLEAMQKVEL